MAKASNDVRTALFVEGSTGILQPRLKSAFQEIWNRHIAASVGFQEFQIIEPISKKTLIAMYPETPVSGRDIPLDSRIAKTLSEKPFDIAVIAWDLMPPWDPTAKKCRWEETLKLYNGLRASKKLPKVWRDRAEARYQELTHRQFPSDRRSLQPFASGEVYAVCMEPMFESLLILCERSVRTILGYPPNSRGTDWPRWEKSALSADKLLDSAIKAARQAKSKAVALKHINGGMHNAKNEWGEYFLREMLSDEVCRAKIEQHPLFRRLSELLVR